MGLTQEEFGKLLGKNQWVVSNWERNITIPNAEIFEKIKKYSKVM